MDSILSTAYRMVDNPAELKNVLRTLNTSEKDELIKYLVKLVVYFKSQAE